MAKYIQGVLEREGIPSELVGADPHRLSPIARLKGSGTGVVGVQPGRWSEDPFGAKLIDGHIRGRGTIDDKDLVAGGPMTMPEPKAAASSPPAARSSIGEWNWWKRSDAV